MNICKYQITVKDFPYKCCKAQKYCPPVICPNNYGECPVCSQEYNNNTSAGHPIKDDDIVRYSEEIQRIKDKEP